MLNIDRLTNISLLHIQPTNEKRIALVTLQRDNPFKLVYYELSIISVNKNSDQGCLPQSLNMMCNQNAVALIPAFVLT